MEYLGKEEVKRVIEGRGNAGRLPILYDMWIYTGVFGERQKEYDAFLDAQPKDVDFIDLNIPDTYKAPENDPSYKWAPEGITGKEGVGIDRNNVAGTWEDMAAVYDNFPSAEHPNLIPAVKINEKKYTLGRWCFCFFERLWSLRGMENALMDFYLYPEEVHRLFEKLTVYYMRVMERAKKELGLDGIFVTDDIGTQTGPFFSLEIFREFFKPYYKQLIDKAHSLGMHFWLHTCGNVELFMREFIEIGLDVIHPIQKNAMDQVQTAQKYGGEICFLVGFDVQQTIPFGTEEEIRHEVRTLADAFWRPDGRFLLTMGNGSTPDWKIESLKALYDETKAYQF